MSAFTQEQYNALVSAIAQGAREVWYGDKRVQYNSFDEMLRLKQLMEKELGLTTASSKSYGEYSKGLQ